MTATSATAGPHAEAPSASPEATAVLPSFRSVYDDYFDFIWTCTRRLGVPTEAVDDVVQEIFLVVHARLKTLERPASLRSWLYGVVRRTVSTYHRGRRVRSAREAPDPFHDHATMQPSPWTLRYSATSSDSSGVFLASSIRSSARSSSWSSSRR